MMDNFYRHVLTVIVIAVVLDSASAGEYCFVGDNTHYVQTNLEYCDDGCCGDIGNRYCCLSLDIGAIVGGVIGGITLLSIIISVICVCLKKSHRPGQVVQPTPAGGAVAVMSTSYPQGYSMAGQQFQGGQPMHGFTGNPAYPPNHGANPAYPLNHGANPAYPTPYPSNSGEQVLPPAAAPK